METRSHAAALSALFFAFFMFPIYCPVLARPAVAGSARISQRAVVGSTARPRRSPGARSSPRGSHKVTQYLGSRRRVVSVTRHRRHYHRPKRARRAPPVRYAYPLEFFMLKAPEFDRSPLPTELAQQVRNSFLCGNAEHIPARALVRAGVARHYPMRGGIFWRREAVKYIVIHSTETGVPLNAKQVVESWSSMGRRHPGAQYVVERDGTIYQAVDPDLGAVHVNIFKTLAGINNDNSIGIEMVHTGRQTYPPEQRSSVIRLVHYLQDRYRVSDENVITHRYAQQGDHTDPVAFNWDGFLKEKTRFRTVVMANRLTRMVEEAEKWWRGEWPVASLYLQMHGKLPIKGALPEKDMGGPDAAQARDKNSQGQPGITLPEPAEASRLLPVNLAPLPAVATQSVAPGPEAASPPAPSPVLRGPIEVDPKTAGWLSNSASGESERSAFRQAEASVPTEAEAPSENAKASVEYFIHQPLSASDSNNSR